MLCQRCQEKEATVKFTKINNGIQETNYLCEQCAKETGALNMFGSFGLGVKPPEQLSRVRRRLTERAHMALSFAEKEARERQSGYINTEHMLLGLFAVSDGLAARVLDELHLSDDMLQEIIDDAANQEGNFQGFSPRAKRALQLAVEEAVRSGVNFVDTEHLLLGLAGEEEGLASKWLNETAGADATRIRQMIVTLLSSGRGEHPEISDYGGEETPYGDNDLPERGGNKSKTPLSINLAVI